MRKLAGVVIGLMLVLAGILAVQHLFRPRPEPQPEALPEAGISSRVFLLEEAQAPPAVMKADLYAGAPPGSTEAELTPEEVIDQAGCSLHAGEGAAGDMAIVVTPAPGGDYRSARFSTLDESGAVHAGTLPFYPLRVRLGRTEHGEAVAGFGGISVDVPNSAGLPLFGGGEPLRVYRGGALIYEKESVWLFDVASDGSSFFYIEPLGSDWSSRLVIVNLEQGTEAHHDLDSLFADPQRSLRYLAIYTSSNGEIHLEPISARYSKGLGVHYFFSAEGERPGRGIQVPDTGRDDHAHFVSSEEGYWLAEGSDGAGNLQIMKVRFDWDQARSATEWHVHGASGTRASGVRTSRDGARLLFGTATASTADRPAQEDDWMLYVLDADTGEADFALPKLDAAQQLDPLSSVLPPQATKEDAGWYNGAFFSGDDQLVVRRIPTPGGAPDRARRFYDVYDLNSVSLYGQPEYRTEGNQHESNPCASRGFPGSLVATADGRLAWDARLP